MPMSRGAALWPGPASRLRPPLSLPWAAVLAAGACLVLAFGLSARWQQRSAAAWSPPVLWVQPVSPPVAPEVAQPVEPPTRAAAPTPPEATSPPAPAAAPPRKSVAAPAQSRRVAAEPASRTPASQDARGEKKPPTDADPVSAQVEDAPPGAGHDAPAAPAPAAAPASAPTQAPATAASPVRSDARTVCPVQVEPKWPETVYTEALSDEVVVKTLARVRDGRVVSVDILSGPRVLHRAVREAMLQYRCQTLPGVIHEITQDFSFRQEPAR